MWAERGLGQPGKRRARYRAACARSPLPGPGGSAPRKCDTRTPLGLRASIPGAAELFDDRDLVEQREPGPDCRGRYPTIWVPRGHGVLGGTVGAVHRRRGPHLHGSGRPGPACRDLPRTAVPSRETPAQGPGSADCRSRPHAVAERLMPPSPCPDGSGRCGLLTGADLPQMRPSADWKIRRKGGTRAVCADDCRKVSSTPVGGEQTRRGAAFPNLRGR